MTQLGSTVWSILAVALVACGDGGSTPDAPTNPIDAAPPDAFDCTTDPVPPGGACPVECTGGCQGTTCTIACGPAGCNDTTVTCPASFACAVVCNGVDACDTTIINCPSGHACEVTCDELDACGDLVLNCGAASCVIACGATGGEACTGAQVQCGAGPCQAVCEGTSMPVVTCGASCGCAPCS